jgi:hypothetical protein
VSDAVAITSDVRGAMERVADEVSRITHEEIVQAARDGRARIRSEWPRDTGYSGDAFTDAEEAYGASIRGPAPYSAYVHEGRAAVRAETIAVEEVNAALTRAADRITR